MKATLEIPASGNIGRSCWDNLPDDVAMTMGRRAAQTLLEHEGFVIVTLTDGTKKVIGHDTLSGELIVGTLTYEYRTMRHGLKEAFRRK